jgi:pimeloyl-ACP methyl ester carboxylesterase
MPRCARLWGGGAAAADATGQNAMVWRFLLFGLALLLGWLPPQMQARENPLGIALEGFEYPFPVAFFPVRINGEELRLAYMDVAPTGPGNGHTALLLHGRNFPASYWAPTIKVLAAAGYRVVVPDQLGFGKSSKPVFDYHFDDMAGTTAALLEKLQIERLDLVGHSMGGMLAVRFARNYPQKVDRLVLESPIGLEDYRFYVLPTDTQHLIERERNLSAADYREQLMTNYSISLPSAVIEPFVEIRERVKESGEYDRWLHSFVNSYQMIYREPVVHEIPLITQETLFIMGANDHNAPGRAFAPQEARAKMGQNAELAKKLASRMRAARVVVVAGVGHLVHLEAEGQFNDLLLRFLGETRSSP